MILVVGIRPFKSAYYDENYKIIMKKNYTIFWNIVDKEAEKKKNNIIRRI